MGQTWEKNKPKKLLFRLLTRKKTVELLRDTTHVYLFAYANKFFSVSLTTYLRKPSLSRIIRHGTGILRPYATPKPISIAFSHKGHKLVFTVAGNALLFVCKINSFSGQSRLSVVA